MEFQGVVGAEFPANYRDQGLHPVHLGDTFANGRYTIRNKLGYGTTSTIWLAHDSVSLKYVSLEIVSAVQSPGTQLEVLTHLQSTYNASEEGSQYVMQMIDHFFHNGPNGTHLCIVGEVLGPSLAIDIEELWYNEIFPPPVAKRLISQIALAVKYLHRREIAHGDLHMGNILLYAPQIASWSDADIEIYLGEPLTTPIQYKGTPSNPKSIPKYAVCHGEESSLLKLCFEGLKPHVKICDFGEAYHPNVSIPRGLATPYHARPPEGILSRLSHATLETDIWALANLFHGPFRGGCGLFLDRDNILPQMVLLIGKLPEPYWSQWEERKKFFDEKGHVLPTYDPKLWASGNFLKFNEDTMGGIEIIQFEQLLRSMVRYDAKERITAADVISSEWFVNFCRGMWQDAGSRLRLRKGTPGGDKPVMGADGVGGDMVVSGGGENGVKPLVDVKHLVEPRFICESPSHCCTASTQLAKS